MNKEIVDKRLVAKYARNILAIYMDADDLTHAAGAVWYSLEAQRCADYAFKHGLMQSAVAGAAAAISPGMKWETVLSYVDALRKDSNVKVPTYSRENCRKAVRCLTGEEPLTVLGGPKVRAFYMLLARVDMDAVVIDGHAFNIARGERSSLRGNVPEAARVTERRYILAAQAYRDVAELVGTSAHVVQATTWIHWRNLHARQPGE